MQNCLIECFGSTNRQFYKVICPRTWKFPDGFRNKMCWVTKSCELLSHMEACWACTKPFIMEHQQLLCQFFAITIQIQKKQKPTVMVRIYSNLFKTFFIAFFQLYTSHSSKIALGNIDFGKTLQSDPCSDTWFEIPTRSKVSEIKTYSLFFLYKPKPFIKPRSSIKPILPLKNFFFSLSRGL